MEDRFSNIYNLMIAIAIFILLNSCEKVDLDAISNLNGNRITLIGHGGMGFTSAENNLPHNSFGSVTKAVEAYGVEGVEVDIQLSSDGVIFMYHDDQLESESNCSGCIVMKSSDELVNCRFRSGYRSNLFSNEKLSPLERILERFAERAVKPLVILDIKLAQRDCGDFDYDLYLRQFADEIARLIIKYDALDWCIVEARMDFLMKVKEKIPAVKLSLIPEVHAEATIIAAEDEGIFMISCNNNLISKDFVQFVHERGMRVAIYSVKIRSAAVKAINKSPDFIYTDNVVLLQEMLR